MAKNLKNIKQNILPKGILKKISGVTVSISNMHKYSDSCSNRLFKIILVN